MSPSAPACVESAASHTGLPHAYAPSMTLQISNLVLSQVAWFAIVLGAANGMKWQCLCVMLVVMAWHLWQVARPVTELKLIAYALSVGVMVEAINASLGFFHPIADGSLNAAASSRYVAALWLVALWGLLAISLNVTLRWLKGRRWLCVLSGAVAGPVAYSAGMRLGALEFVHPAYALLSLSLLWAIALPVLVTLGMRADGVRTINPLLNAEAPRSHA